MALVPYWEKVCGVNWLCSQSVLLHIAKIIPSLSTLAWGTLWIQYGVCSYSRTSSFCTWCVVSSAFGCYSTRFAWGQGSAWCSCLGLVSLIGCCLCIVQAVDGYTRLWVWDAKRSACPYWCSLGASRHSWWCDWVKGDDTEGASCFTLRRTFGSM